MPKKKKVPSRGGCKQTHRQAPVLGAKRPRAAAEQELGAAETVSTISKSRPALAVARSGHRHERQQAGGCQTHDEKTADKQNTNSKTAEECAA